MTRRRFAHSSSATWTRSGAASSTTIGSRPSCTKSRSRERKPALVDLAPLLDLAAREPQARGGAALRIADRHDDAFDLGEALLPGRVLDDDRNDVPAAGDRLRQKLVRRGRDEVGDDEDEAAERDGALDGSEERECLRDGVIGGVEGVVEERLEPVREALAPDVRVRARRLPEGGAGVGAEVRREVEVGKQARWLSALATRTRATSCSAAGLCSQGRSLG